MSSTTSPTTASVADSQIKEQVEAQLQSYARFGVDLGLNRIEAFTPVARESAPSSPHRPRCGNQRERVSLRLPIFYSHRRRLSHWPLHLTPFGELDRAHLHRFKAN